MFFMRRLKMICGGEKNGTPGETRTRMSLLTLDFESNVSTNSTTGACYYFVTRRFFVTFNSSHLDSLSDLNLTKNR